MIIYLKAEEEDLESIVYLQKKQHITALSQQSVHIVLLHFNVKKKRLFSEKIGLFFYFLIYFFGG